MRRQKVPFEPLEPGKVGMYVCGPTPYAPAHIGHAYSAISFDTIRRSLRFLGYQVRYVRNITDVDDKIIKRANEVGEDPMALAARFAADYNRDMARFGVLPPDVEPKVSTHIAEIIALIERLDRERHGLRRSTATSTSTSRRSRRTASCQRQSLDELARRRARRGRRAQARRPPTSRCGRRPSPASRRGTRRGARAGPAGTSSARR